MCAELDQLIPASRHDRLNELFADHRAAICDSTGGRTEIRLTVPGHDLWMSVLATMVALTDAGCTPVALHIVQRHQEGL